MKTEDILALDVRKKENAVILQKALRKIKPLAKYDMSENVPQEMLEKVIDKICRSYEIEIQYIMVSHVPDEVMWWTASAKRTDNHKWLGSVFGHTMYELISKLTIKLYSCVKNEGVKRREVKEEDE